MKQAFIQQIKEVNVLEELVKGYMGSRTFLSIQAEIIAFNWRSVHVKSNRTQAQFSPIKKELRDIIHRVDTGLEDVRFRLLIIGKPSSGRTMILNKVRAVPKILYTTSESHKW